MALHMNIGTRLRSARDSRRIVKIVADVHPDTPPRWGCNPAWRVVVENEKTGRRYKVSTDHLAEEYIHL